MDSACYGTLLEVGQAPFVLSGRTARGPVAATLATFEFESTESHVAYLGGHLNDFLPFSLRGAGNHRQGIISSFVESARVSSKTPGP